MIGHSNTAYSTIGLPRDEWVRRRHVHPDHPEHGYIGASQVATLLGVSPYSTPFELWALLTGRVPGPESNLPMRLGTFAEAFVLQEFERETGLSVETWPYVLQHPTVARSRCNLDATTARDDDSSSWQTARAVVEAKMPGSRQRAAWKELRDTGIPRAGSSVEGYVLQVQDQLSVTGLQTGYLAAVCDGDVFVCRIERDEAIIAMIEQAIAGFWAVHVEADVAPPITSPVDLDVVGRIYRQAIDDRTVTLEGLDEALDRLHEVKEELKAMGDEKKTIEATIKAAMGDAPAALIGERRITWSNSARTRLDTTALKTAHPEIVAEFMKTTNVRTFRPGGSK